MFSKHWLHFNLVNSICVCSDVYTCLLSVLDLCRWCGLLNWVAFPWWLSILCCSLRRVSVQILPLYSKTAFHHPDQVCVFKRYEDWLTLLLSSQSFPTFGSLSCFELNLNIMWDEGLLYLSVYRKPYVPGLFVEKTVSPWMGLSKIYWPKI